MFKIIIVSISVLSCLQMAKAETVTQTSALQQSEQQMNEAPWLPADLSEAFISCPIGANASPSGSDYLTARQVDYQQRGWEKRINADWDYFSALPAQGKVLVIDFAKRGNQLAYRYLANANTQEQLYEPWSSSKIMAFTAAVAKARKDGGVGANSKVGETHLADLITSINSYAPFGQADGNSNAIATYFLNAVGRDKATALFHDDWLKLSNPDVRFRGAYALKVFKPATPVWQALDSDKTVTMPELQKGSDDPGYQSYQCDDCDKTGNKPMTTLAEAEWLKRLASHERDKLTRLPGLESEDVRILFYAKGHTDSEHQVGGMLQGINTMLSRALANVIAGEEAENPKAVLDKATDGKWRIWQKVGWGPSGTRGTGENVVLAHVCLPGFDGGREFTLAAQASHPGNSEKSVSQSGIKMQALLNQSISELFAK